jgi:hypothetical protein
MKNPYRKSRKRSVTEPAKILIEEMCCRRKRRGKKGSGRRPLREGEPESRKALWARRKAAERRGSSGKP